MLTLDNMLKVEDIQDLTEALLLIIHLPALHMVVMVVDQLMVHHTLLQLMVHHTLLQLMVHHTPLQLTQLQLMQDRIAVKNLKNLVKI
jgi:hypothetical protein